MPRPASAAAANEARNSEGVSTGMGDPPRLCPVATRGWRRTRLDTAMVRQTGQAGRRVSAIARHDRAGPAARVTDAATGPTRRFATALNLSEQAFKQLPRLRNGAATLG